MQIHTPRLARGFSLLAAMLVLLLVTAACAPPPSASTPGISAQDVWARAAKMTGAMGETTQQDDMAMPGHGGGNGAIYMVLANGGATADRLVAAQADVAQAIEIHETTMEGDVMRMQQVQGGIEIPAKGEVELKPGGYHVMLIGLTRDLNVGDTFPLTLQFESGTSLVVEAEVRQP